MLLSVPPWMASIACPKHTRAHHAPIGAVIFTRANLRHDVTEGLVVIGHGPSVDVAALPHVGTTAQELIQAIAATAVMEQRG
eukprot:9311548-Pyramimonas_sp.AAC.1